MFNPPAATTRDRVFHTALALFRRDGFDRTTMRDVAREAGLSLGAAYHYFPGKDAIVAAYYDLTLIQHRERVESALGAPLDLAGRLGAAYHAILDILRDDRPLLGVLFRLTGDPDHPLSLLGEHTHDLREASILTYAIALGDLHDPDLNDIAPLALWSLHMGFILYFLYDRSEDGAPTRRLVDGTVPLVARALTLVSHRAVRPLARPLLKETARLLRETGLLHPASTPPTARGSSSP